MIHLYRSSAGCTTVKADGVTNHLPGFDVDELFQQADPLAWLEGALDGAAAGELHDRAWSPPIGSQEVWAAGVTYFQSRSARMEESEASGGDRFYDMVYEADRPEIFFKATAPRVRGHLDQIRVRADSTWDVPEPELTLAINSAGKVFGATIGNDVSSRSIEGENPLYLPQAKVYRGSCALGPALVVGAVLEPEVKIKVQIERGGESVFAGATDLGQIKRGFDELAEFLFRENEFPVGAYLMTGTGVVPGADFSLTSGDIVHIEIDGLGRLSNAVE
ncbi:MAG: 2-dehydro-3-deoxy-D-arabinonate dehydratase [Pseudoalteromonas tetraodonis]|jgi:2-dehydro-3-deoxy-D-arabinonate dehydratase